jgi:hypothetical protein
MEQGLLINAGLAQAELFQRLIVQLEGEIRKGGPSLGQFGLREPSATGVQLPLEARTEGIVKFEVATGARDRCGESLLEGLTSLGVFYSADVPVDQKVTRIAAELLKEQR